MTLIEGHSHSNWNHSVEFSRVMRHMTKFETNQFTSVPTQTNGKGVFYQIPSVQLSPLSIAHAKYSASAITGCGNRLIFILVDWIYVRKSAQNF